MKTPASEMPSRMLKDAKVPAASAAQHRRHVLTVNLEDYYQVGPLSQAIPQRYWPRFEMRVEKNTIAALDLLDEYGHKAVFFTIGWLAEKFPDIMREVVRRGHEIGSKGFYHRSLAQMTPGDFREDAVRSRLALEKNCGKSVVGYRVARGWFSEKDLWALDILAEEGFQYDSSLRPLGFSLIGQPERRAVHRHHGKRASIWELPLSSWRVGPLSVPISGGNYVRQFPHEFTRRRISEWVTQGRGPLVFYFHIWELDPEQPRITGVSKLNVVRQYRNLQEMPGRIRHYLQTYSFVSPADYLGIRIEDAECAREEQPTPASPAKLFGELRQPVTIVVPCYNEETNLLYLANTLDRFVEEFENVFDFSFVFVDDGSRDRTHARMKDIFGKRLNCQVVAHPKNRGVAAATLTGLAAARTEIVCVLDADCSYDPAQLTRMIPMLDDGVDLVTASPYHADGAVLNVPRWRLFLSRGVSTLYRALLTNKLATYTACVRVYRRSKAVHLKVENEGYFGITEILIRLDQSGARIVEFPAILEARVLGVSKMKVLKTILGHLRLLTQLARERLLSAVRTVTPFLCVITSA